MDNKVIRSIVFLAGLAFIVWGLGQVLESVALRIDPNEAKVREALGLRGESYNTLILGNSVAQQGFNTRVIDSIASVNSYNLAVGGASVFTMELLLRNYLQHNRKPERVIYGIYVNEKEWPDKVRPSIRAAMDGELLKAHFESNKDVVRERGLDFYSNFKLFQFRNVLEHYLKFKYNPDLYRFEYHKGFLIRRSVGNPVTKHPENRAGNNIKALKRLASLCDELGIDILFVEPPNHTAFNEATVNRLDAIQELMTVPEIAGNYYDLNHPSEYTDVHWGGINHLNYDGASRFSAEVAAELKERN